MTDDLELRIIDMSKAEKALQKDKYNRLAQWLTFMDNPNTERVEEIVKENEEVKKAKSVLCEMSEDEKLQRLAELREKWDIDERSALSSAKEEGIEQGMEKTKFEVAKKMKDENMDIQMIIKITGLSKEVIENL